MGPGGMLTQLDGMPDFAARFADAGIAALTFDYRHWGQSEGEPRRLGSVPRQLSDWRSVVGHARELEGIDPDVPAGGEIRPPRGLTYRVVKE